MRRFGQGVIPPTPFIALRLKITSPYDIDESVTRHSSPSHLSRSGRLLPALPRSASAQALARSWPHACRPGADRYHSIVHRDIHRPDRQA